MYRNTAKKSQSPGGDSFHSDPTGGLGVGHPKLTSQPPGGDSFHSDHSGLVLRVDVSLKLSHSPGGYSFPSDRVPSNVSPCRSLESQSPGGDSFHSDP